MAAFKGGVHPPETKEFSAHRPISVLHAPKTVVIPLHQHLGAPCKPTVKAREHVALGQLVGEPQGRVSAPVHSSVSGTVKSIEPMSHPSGKRVEALVIEVDAEQPEWPWTQRRAAPTDPQEVLKAISEAGIVGMGGAGFPTHVKLNPPPGKRVDTVILNGCECEPFLTADHRLMVEQAERIAAGMRHIMHAMGVARGVVALEDNKPDAAEKLRNAPWPEGVAVRVLPTRYPQGAEKMLIKACLGRRVPSGGLPMDVGVVVQNVATAAAVADAVEYGTPLIRRVVTLTGPGVQEPGNYLVPIGMTVGDLVEAAGGLREGAGAVIFGGPMMGVAQATMDSPIIKTTSGVVVLMEGQVSADGPMPCLRCGRCVEVCPMGLAPVMLARSAYKERLDLMEKLSILDCIECGCCAFTCPSHRPLVPWIRLGKGLVTAARRRAA